MLWNSILWVGVGLRSHQRPGENPVDCFRARVRVGVKVKVGVRVGIRVGVRVGVRIGIRIGVGVVFNYGVDVKIKVI